MNYVFFTMLRATPAWLALSRQHRKELGDQHLGTVLRVYAGKLHMRYFDAEAFTAQCSDLMMTETQNPQHHYFFMEQLRDSPLITHPYFEIVQIVPTVEDGYQAYEESLAR